MNSFVYRLIEGLHGREIRIRLPAGYKYFLSTQESISALLSGYGGGGDALSSEVKRV